MKHLIICREYPPAPSGGIGTYVDHISRLLAESGETVHVIGQMWAGAEKTREERCAGRLIIHRIPFEDWTVIAQQMSPAIDSPEGRGLYESSFPPQSFSWQAGLLAEHLIEQEGIDIVEAQDYEAPLYYLQLRRALGLGPKRQPPCLVHLHSPSQFIARYDEWDGDHPAHTTATRLEDYTIQAADALLCPSRYLARQIEALYGFADESIRVIPYPLGDTPIVERDSRTWERGTICYLGRLERRKGILEWLDAAVSVAREYPTASFEFIGANVLGTSIMSGDDFVRRRIPEDLTARFHFRGHHQRAHIPHLLAQARAAVVPSRWENFPNSCIEALGTGLPVIASCEGGMVEMIEDGRTGWIVNPAGSEGLAAALRRALDTPTQTLAGMGREAAASIRLICDNGTIVQHQLDLRKRLVQQGATRSIHVPASLPEAKASASRRSRDSLSGDHGREGLGLVITCSNNGQRLDDCFASVTQQTRKFTYVVIVDEGSTEEQTLHALDQAELDGWEVIRRKQERPNSAKNLGLAWMLLPSRQPLAVVFLDAKDRLKPDFVSVCESIFQRDAGIGIVSCWALDLSRNSELWSKPCPSFPYQWLANDVVPFAAARTDALLAARPFRDGMDQGYDCWDLFDRVMASGWKAVTVPIVLAEGHFLNPARPYKSNPYEPGHFSPSV